MRLKPLIIHIITRLEPGGSSRNTVDSCASQSKDFDVILLHGPHPGTEQLLKLLPPAVNCIEIRYLQRELSPLKDLKALLELSKELRELAPDIVHTHTSKAGALGRLAARAAGLLSKKPAIVVHTPHGHLLYGYYGPVKTAVFRLAERFLSRFTDHFIAGELNESVAAGLGRREQWVVVHSGVDFTPPAVPARKPDLGIEKDELAVGTVARLEPVKGVEYFIRAAALLKARGLAAKARFVVIGDGELETQLRNLSDDLGLGDRVIFTGFRRDVAALLSALDVYVQPSLNEGMGRAPLEAQARGVPVVVSRVCGLPDVIREGETGFAVNPGDPDELADKLGLLLLSPELRARMGKAAAEWASAKDETGFPHFGVESMNARLESFYRKTLRDAGKAGV